jgi:flagellar M-ring protein FliF
MAGAGNSGGVPGTTSNVPGATGATSATGASDAQSSRSESATYAVSKTVRHEIEPAGRVRRISAAVLLDDVTEMKQENGKQIESRRKRTPEELKQIEQVASAVIGLDSTRGDVISVQNMPFEHAPAAAPADIKPNKVQKVQEFVRDWSVAVRYATIVLIFLIVYLLMLRPVKKQFLTAFKEVAEQRKLAAAAQAKLQETSMPQLSGAQQETVNLKKQIAEKIKADPAGTSRLVRGWLREEPQ